MCMRTNTPWMNPQDNMAKLRDAQSFEEKFSTKGPKPLQQPRGYISQKHIEKKMRKWTDYNLQLRNRGQR